MITLVIGPPDSGKTTWLARAAASLPDAGGILLRKQLDEQSGDVSGYDAVSIADKTVCPLVRRHGYEPAGWDPVDHIGPYSFSGAGFDFCRRILLRDLASGATPIMLDEIGPLELDGRGFARIFEQLVQTGPDLMVAVRNACVAAVIARFALPAPRLVHIPDERRNETPLSATHRPVVTG